MQPVIRAQSRQRPYKPLLIIISALLVALAAVAPLSSVEATLTQLLEPVIIPLGFRLILAALVVVFFMPALLTAIKLAKQQAGTLRYRLSAGSIPQELYGTLITGSAGDWCFEEQANRNDSQHSSGHHSSKKGATS